MRLSPHRGLRRLRSYRFIALVALVALVTLVAMTGCAITTAGNDSSATTATATTATAAATATPQPACAQLVTGATPFQSVSGVPGLKAPAGTYIGPATSSGGGAGQYTITAYTLCFQGGEADIDGGLLIPSATPKSTVGYLIHSGWKLNNLFPDPATFAYLNYCSNAHICVNSSGSGAPFTFVGFDEYTSHSGGYMTVRLEVAKIAAPSCLNDAQYYSGMPKYTIYEDGNAATSSSPTYHFLMPPATRVSTYLGGGTAGSTYVYFCSAGTKTTIVAFLKNAMQNDGYAVSNVTASGFSATTGSGPTHQVDVSVSSASNYYLRVFVPY